MSYTLLKASKILFTNELKAKASIYLGETEDNVAKALDAVVPSLLVFFAEKSNAANGSNILTSMISNQYASATHLNLEHYFSIENGSLLNKGDRIAGELLGNRTGNFIGNISTYAGIKPVSAACLLSIAVPALLALAGDTGIRGYNSNVKKRFEGIYKDILAAIPRDFNVKNILNDAEVIGGPTGKSKQSADHLYKNEKKESALHRVLSTILLLILAAIISWYFFGKKL
jgi:hypothetical protein